MSVVLCLLTIYELSPERCTELNVNHGSSHDVGTFRAQAVHTLNDTCFPISLLNLCKEFVITNCHFLTYSQKLMLMNIHVHT